MRDFAAICVAGLSKRCAQGLGWSVGWIRVRRVRRQTRWAVVFDLDGTLADTRNAIVFCLQRSFREEGLPVPPETCITPTIGLDLAASIERACQERLSSARISAIADRYRRLYLNAGARLSRPFPGALRVVAGVRSHGAHAALATSKSRQGTSAFIARNWSTNPFDHTVTDDDVVAKKPAPEMVDIVAKRLDLAPTSVLVVGDTAFDVAMGKAAGTATCGVTWGNHSRDVLVDAGADYVADSPSGLGVLIASLAERNSLSPASPLVGGMT